MTRRKAGRRHAVSTSGRSSDATITSSKKARKTVELPEANQDLMDLTNYLIENEAISNVLDFEVVHDEVLDADNRKDPRAFCSVAPKDVVIHCAKNIECLPDEARIGVLLHEIAHVAANAFGDDECEVDADVWIHENVPEAGYNYAASVVYRPTGEESSTAQNLQVVNLDFVRMIRDA